MIKPTRRELLKAGAYTSAAGYLAARSSPLMAMVGSVPEPVPPIQDPRLKALVQRGLDAAKSAGASYADVRLTYTRLRGTANAAYTSTESEMLHASVRALVNGYWGFASSPVWSPDELARLGREAARQASTNALGKPRKVNLPPTPIVADAHWETPVKVDAWTVHPMEISDFLMGINNGMVRELKNLDRYGKLADAAPDSRMMIYLSERAFGSTDGSYCTQRLHWIEGGCDTKSVQWPGTDAGLLTGTAAGWEHFTEQPVIEAVIRNCLENAELAKLPEIALDVGRYDVVLDAASVARLISDSIGAASEIDRALGYEANATGTSYLKSPDEMLGTFQLGSPLLTVTANRSERGGVATVQWDGEGVAPEDFTIVKNGILTDFQTHREGAGWLHDAYTRLNRPFRSHGCADAETAANAVLVRTANLVMTPSTENVTVQDLESNMKRGLSFIGLGAGMDFQLSGGEGVGLVVCEIKNGKRAARFSPRTTGMLFRTTEFWKNILGIGGASSAERIGRGFILNGDRIKKGMPEQYGRHSVTAVPVAVKDIAIIDRERR